MNANGAHRHRVAVTGIGIVSPIGIGVRAFWEGTLAGKIGVGALTRFDASGFGSRVAAQIDEFDAAGFVPVKRLRRTDRYAQFSIAAARLAFEDAGLSVDGMGDEIGVWIGSALGGLAFAEEQHSGFHERGAKAVRPLLAISVFVGAGTSNVALEFGLRGPNVANANSCAAGTVALGEAFRAISRGDVRAAIAGGAEAPLSPLVFGSFAVIHAMSTRNDDPVHASRPFDAERDGFVMSEGAGIFVLERYEDAVARGARVYGEIAGFGLTGDAHHMTSPLPDGTSAARAMTDALREAHVAPAEVELYNAHGSSSQLNDVTEARSMKRAFGAAAARIPVTASKGQHGHALGATGAWETALSLLAMHERRVPRIVNLENVDPACDLDFVREDRRLAPRVVLTNSTGFGGINAALVLRRDEP